MLPNCYGPSVDEVPNDTEFLIGGLPCSVFLGRRTSQSVRRASGTARGYRAPVPRSGEGRAVQQRGTAAVAPEPTWTGIDRVGRPLTRPSRTGLPISGGQGGSTEAARPSPGRRTWTDGAQRRPSTPNVPAGQRLRGHVLSDRPTARASSTPSGPLGRPWAVWTVIGPSDADQR
jgi:hypothetical protein